jgi:hypothetical protein
MTLYWGEQGNLQNRRKLVIDVLGLGTVLIFTGTATKPWSRRRGLSSLTPDWSLR